MPGIRRSKNTFLVAIMIYALTLLRPAASVAQSHPEYLTFRRGVKGALYKPDSGPAPHVGIILMHRTANFLNHIATTELSKRGFLVLGMNPRSDNNEAAVNWESIPLDVKEGVDFMRKQPGITKIILFGHSGGGATMSFYQAVAEKGPSYCQGANKLLECGNDLAGLPKADGMILVDAHPSNPINGVRDINPALLDESDPGKVDPNLDPFNPSNGYRPDGSATYPEAFKQKYFKAQADRMNKLIERALARRKQMKAGTDIYPDDDVFLVVRGNGARLMELDTSIHHATLQPRKLLKNDGTISTQIVESVRHFTKGQKESNSSFTGGTRLLTIRSFLGANAVRSTNSMDGIDWCSSNNSVPCAVQQISVPVLFTAMGGHYFIRDNEIHYEMSASKDKDFVIIEGATHGIAPCTECETTPGQYSNTVKNFFDYLMKWINARF
jgi:pimeloyl-ACP methyl ester carboxylesterase